MGGHREAKGGGEADIIEKVERLLEQKGQIRRMQIFIVKPKAPVSPHGAPKKEPLQDRTTAGESRGEGSSATVAVKLVDSEKGALAAVTSANLPPNTKINKSTSENFSSEKIHGL